MSHKRSFPGESDVSSMQSKRRWMQDRHHDADNDDDEVGARWKKNSCADSCKMVIVLKNVVQWGLGCKSCTS